MSAFVPCPCCALPTLDRRAWYEVCPVCWWEDEGIDEPDEESAANHGYTLRRARANYAARLDMYDEGKGIGVVANPSPARKTLLAYLKSVRDGERGYDERTLHGLLRGLDHG